MGKIDNKGGIGSSNFTGASSNENDSRKLQDVMNSHTPMQNMANRRSKKDEDEENGEATGENNKASVGSSKSSSSSSLGTSMGKTGAAVGGLKFPKLSSQTRIDSEEKTSAINEDVKKIKKVGKIMKFLAPLMPYILMFLGIIILIAFIYGTVMAIIDQVVDVAVSVMKTTDRFSNFVSGNGWNTEEEAFFVKLKQAYVNYDQDGELDIPLLASTIHYSNMMDVSVFDGEDNENADKVSDDEIDSNLDLGIDGGSIFGAIIETYQTRNFYNVANVKLGEMNIIPFPGKRGLLGHLVSAKINFKLVCVSKAPGAWIDFIGEIIDFKNTSFEEYENIYDGNSIAAAASMISDIVGVFTGTFFGFLDEIDKMGSFFAEGQSYNTWLMQNTFYDLKEIYSLLTGNYFDDWLYNSPLSYYGELAGTGSKNSGETASGLAGDSDYNNKMNNSGNGENDKGECILPPVLVPVFETELDYKAYYRYLVNVYIPLTYFPKMKLGVDYTRTDLIVIANEIFDQKNMYNYLVNRANTSGNSGLTLGQGGYLIRTGPPTPNDIYWKTNYVGDFIGQCVWYMKGRALEIIDNSMATKDLKEQAFNKVWYSGGNGGDWYTNGMCDTFACSNDYTKPRAGAIAVYKFTPAYQASRNYSVNYGHVVVIEQVDGNTVYTTDGWNSCGGANGQSSWACVGFRYEQHDVSFMSNFGGNYIFVGYVYLLG